MERRNRAKVGQGRNMGLAAMGVGRRAREAAVATTTTVTTKVEAEAVAEVARANCRGVLERRHINPTASPPRRNYTEASGGDIKGAP